MLLKTVSRRRGFDKSFTNLLPRRDDISGGI
jgi:hypothetical protein